MLAKNYTKQNPAGWWISEKYDGIRALWDGYRFVSKNMIELKVPEHIVSSMPEGIELDGELWIDRGLFEKTLSEVKSGRFNEVKFMIFDLIDTHDTFEKRQKTLSKINLPGFCRVVMHIKCLSRDHLESFKTDIVSGFGEGVVLRAPNSRYDFKRSTNLLKYKDFKEDECLFVGCEKDNEVFLCKWNGKFIRLHSGLSSKIKQNPPEVGSLITFSYSGVTAKGLPRCAKFKCIRFD